MDITLFKAINNLAGNNPLADRTFIFISSYGPFLLAGLLALLWFWPREHSIRHRQQQIVLIALLSVVVSLLANQVIIRVWDRPRPFTVQATNLLLPPSQEPSFPSDHATFAFAIAVAILLASRRLGIFASFVAVLLAFSRVYIGEHYPSDVIAGALIGGVSTLLLFRMQRYLESITVPILRFARRLRLA